MKKLIIILNIIFILIGLVSIPLALTSPMLFDAPGSEDNKILYVTLFSILVLPVSCFGAVFYSLHAFYKQNQFKKALKVLFIPCFVLLVFLGSMEAIEVFCAGQFSCSK